MSRIRFLLICLALYLSETAQAMHLRVVSQTPVLGAEEARSLMFDHYGLMWIGTDQGVRVFDGYDFRTYRNDAYSPGILPNNYVNAITEDHDGNIWIGTRDGLVCHRRRQGLFHTYHLQGEQTRTINALYTAADGTVWVGTNGGISRYDAGKDDFIDINMTAGVRAFAEDGSGNIYVGTWAEGLYRYDTKSGRLVAYPRMNDRNTVQTMLLDKRGRLWIGTWEHGIICLDTPENEAAPGIHRMNDGRRDFRTFYRLVEDSVSHSVWGCCIEGLTRVGLDDLTEIENYPQLTFCYDMITDGHGNLWVLTRDKGIVHMDTKPSPFHFHHLDPTGLVLPVNRIQNVFTPDGNLFLLALQPYGLALYDRTAKRVVYNNHIPGFERMTSKEGGIHVQNILAMKQRDNGEIWMGGTRGIIIWKPGEQARQLSREETPFIGDYDVNTLHALDDGTVLVGLAGGIGIAVSETKGRMLRLTESGRDFSSCDVHAILEDCRHQLWIATENAGIIRVTGDVHNSQTMVCRQYAPENSNYPIDNATTVYEDAARRLWAVSSSGGLFLYNAEEDCFEPVNHRFHINVSSIYAMDSDEGGSIWLTTDKGLVRLTPDAERDHLAYYSVEDGIEALRFSANGLSGYRHERYFGSARGFFSFEPREIDKWQPNDDTAALVVSDLMIDDRPYSRLDADFQRRISVDQPFFTKEITIPASVKKFSFRFVLLAYQKPQQCRYFYRLDGYDSDWHYTDADNRHATYQNLPAGHYELRLRAIDSYGHQTELSYTIAVGVLPPWYRTWWAYLVYAMTLAATIYGISQWYKAQLKRKSRLQQRVGELLHYREMMLMHQFNDRQALEAEEQQHSSPDEQFIQRAIDCVKNHLTDSDYDREQFARDMLVSSSTLYNKLRGLTGQSVTGFVCSIRLKEACRIVRRQPAINVNELSMAVGFNTAKYFARCFKKEFGELPSEYIDRIRSGQ